MAVPLYSSPRSFRDEEGFSILTQADSIGEVHLCHSNVASLLHRVVVEELSVWSPLKNIQDIIVS